MPSQSVEDYLKTIYELVDEGHEPWATTSALAQALKLSPASVTAMLKKLAAQDPSLVQYEPYQGARLTEAGLKEALEVVRHHRLVESFLSAVLGYSWDKVHAEAHRLEHAISDDLEEHLARYLGDPTRDPHGSPIPQRNGAVEELDDSLLTDLPVGQPARVRRVLDHDPALLRYLNALGLVPGARVMVTGRAPFQGPQYVKLYHPAAVHALGSQVTDQVFVVAEDAPAVETGRERKEAVSDERTEEQVE